MFSRAAAVSGHVRCPVFHACILSWSKSYYFSLFLPREARCVCTQAAGRDCQDSIPDWIPSKARSPVGAVLSIYTAPCKRGPGLFEFQVRRMILCCLRSLWFCFTVRVVRTLEQSLTLHANCIRQMRQIDSGILPLVRFTHSVSNTP